MIPDIGLGFAIGVLTSVMGVGGGFIMVPAMIYLLRIPTNVVVGTSLFQIIFVTAYSTIVQAAYQLFGRHRARLLPDGGGVWGAQNGVRVGQRLKAEQFARAPRQSSFLPVGIRLALEHFHSGRPRSIRSRTEGAAR